MKRPALACAAVLLAACAQAPRPASEASGADAALPAARTFFSPSAADQLATYAARLRGMGEAALAAEAARQRREAGDLARVKAAMALSLTPAEEGDILALVDPVMKRDAADGQVRSMASFLHGMALERRRLRESAAAAGTRLRDERRALEAQKQRADAMQERAAQLQQKLDALTELEKSLSDRQTQGR